MLRFMRRSSLALALVSFGFIFVFSPSIQADSSQTEPVKNGSAWNPAQSDQWVATDGLGRALPTFKEVGPTRLGKYVACFYFLWNGRHGEAGPYDISKILKEHPEAKDDPNSPEWGGMGVPHHWAESIFGYYVGEDESVLRKHAQMLGDAGVDVICFDVTNQLTYPESYRALFKVFSEMQKEGNKVPKVAFLCPFWQPNKVVRELWRDVYSQNFYSDVWFYWKGKPLILADPDLMNAAPNIASVNCSPFALEGKDVLAQKFAVEESFQSIVINSPTWQEANSTVNAALRNEAGQIVARRENIKVADNQPYVFDFDAPQEPGVYTAELTKGEGGKIGWWGREVKGNDYATNASKALKQDGVQWLEATRNGEALNCVFMMSVGFYDEEFEQIKEFFTFRPSQPDYFRGPTKPDQWSWLEVYPQQEYYNAQGELEEMCVGVAQNAVEGKLGVLSNPTSCGRSYHNGAEPAPEKCDYSGRNFQEQWERALKVDPEIVFITGWNEWIAGRFGADAPFHGATPVSFVDQYNEEFSRDCEPMKGGHGDAYYYQMISNIRRFKGVSKQERYCPQVIQINGNFDDWGNVQPRFFDTVDDQTRRDSRGWGENTRYTNNTGRNDFVESRVSYDKENIYFYVQMKNNVLGDPTAKNWLALYLDVDEDATTGANGNEFVVMSASKGKGLQLLRTTTKGAVDGETSGSADASVRPRKIEYKVNGKALELAIPRKALGLDNKAPTFRFKWSDGIDPFATWDAFTTDGDAAPNDRYYYRYDASK